MTGTAFEADELYQNAGEKKACPIAIPVTRHVDGPISGKATALMPTIGPHHQHLSRDTGEQRFWVGDHADTRTCRALIAENVPAGTAAYTDEWQSYRGGIPPMPRSAMVYANGRGMTMVMADAKCIATPVRERVRRFLPTP